MAQKQIALNLLKLLKICPDFIEGFDQNQWCCWYEHFIGYWTFQDKELQSEIDQFQTKTGCLVYGVIKNNTEFGEQYTFLVVPSKSEDQFNLVEPQDDGSYIAFSYVWNKNEPYFSEFGSVQIASRFGGLERLC